MVEQIEKIRLLMAEQRYIEAQQLVEQALLTEKSEQLLGLLLEIHVLQGISLPYRPTIEFINLNSDPHKSLELLEKLNTKNIETFLLAIKSFEKLGELEALHQKISEFYLYLYQRKIPRRFEEVHQVRKKYFANDFGLELKEFALLLDLGWSEEAETELKRLIRDCFHKFNTKNKLERISSIESVVNSYNFNNAAKIYCHLLGLYSQGIKEKGDYKKIIELILFFEELDFKAIVLSLIHKLGLTDIAAKFAGSIRNQKDYKFIHFEKYHNDLKGYFIQAKPRDEKSNVIEEIDLTLEEAPLETIKIEWEDETAIHSDLELADGLKHLEYDVHGWLNLASGFIQSDLSKSAFYCAKKVKEMASDDADFLKGSYLAIHALMKLKDYRLALDYCYEAVEKSKDESDLLSFFYLEAELLIKLGEKKSAKKVLDSIKAIDSNYRLSEKMLKRLNEI